jgi:hypothetical protein
VVVRLDHAGKPGCITPISTLERPYPPRCDLLSALLASWQRFVVPRRSGMLVAVPAWRLAELLDSTDVQRLKQTEESDYLTRPQAVATGAPLQKLRRARNEALRAGIIASADGLGADWLPSIPGAGIWPTSVVHAAAKTATARLTRCRYCASCHHPGNTVSMGRNSS